MIKMILHIVISIIFLSCGVLKEKETFPLGTIQDDFIGGSKIYDSIIRNNIVFPEEMKLTKKTDVIYYELTVNKKGQIIQKTILRSNERQFANEILRCLEFVEKGWKIKYDEKNKRIYYRVRGKFYFELF